MTKIIKVFGAPGTGKTTYLIGKVVEELKAGRDISEIAFIGYTRAACLEALDRASKVTQGLDKDTRQWFMTIHATCLKLLYHERLYHDKAVATLTHLREFCKLNNLKPPSSEDELQEGGEISSGTAFFSTRSYLMNTFGEEREWMKVPHADELAKWGRNSNIPDAYPFLAQRYTSWKEEKNLIDYEDMLMDEWCLKLPLPVSVLIVDEFQDISPLQKSIIEQWMKGKERVYVAGDDDQALYGFQGADPTLMLHFPTDEVIVLERSHRCSEEIWKAAQDLILRNENRQKKTVASNAPGGSVRILQNCSIWDIVREISGVTYILLRTNYLASKIAWKLSDTHTLFKYLDPAKDKLWGLTKEKIRLLNWVNGHVTGYHAFGAFERMARKDGYTDMSIRFLSGFLGKGNINPDEIKVFLGTIHSSKGKEADTVIVFNDITPRVYRNLQENPEEERRVFYVAMTRARKKLVIVDRFFGARSIAFDELGGMDNGRDFEERDQQYWKKDYGRVSRVPWDD